MTTDTFKIDLDEVMRDAQRMLAERAAELKRQKPGRLNDVAGEFSAIGQQLDWRAILDDGSRFLRPFLDDCSNTDKPEAYYFWAGLQAVAAAAGRNTVLVDSPRVYSNLFVCLVGASGAGKSQVLNTLDALLETAFPYEHVNGAVLGVKPMSFPNSAEIFVDNLMQANDETSTPGGRPVPRNSWLKIDEYAVLVGVGNRAGNVIKPYLHQAYDLNRVSTDSRSSKESVATGYFFQTSSTTQAMVLRELLSKSDNAAGFVNRWTFVAGTPKPLHAWGRHDIGIEDHARRLREVHAWCGTARDIGIEPAAAAAFEQFFKSTLEPLKLDESQSVLARADLLMKKLLLLLSVDKHEASVSAATVAQVVAMWPYISGILRWVGGAAGKNPVDEIDDKVLRALDCFHRGGTANGRKPSRPPEPWVGRRDLQQRLHGSVTRDELVFALKRLAQHEDIRAETIDGKERFQLAAHPPDDDDIF